MGDLVAVLLLVLGTALGALVQAATGFGFAIVAAPLFLAAMGTTAAVQLLVLLHLVQTAMLVPGLWRLAPRGLLASLVLGAAIGCPLGLAMFLALDVRGLKLLCGLAILVATALLLARERGWLGRPAAPYSPSAAPSHSTTIALPAVATGLVAGAMTALLVMPGPPLMLLLAARPLPKDAARALSLTFFGLCYVAVSLLNVVWGGVSRTTWSTALVLSPLVVVGTLAGIRLAPRLTEGHFRATLLALLLASGILAIATAL